ncbi:MAG: imidazoleglycerol-phosphate dehydratase HisB [Lachnospiraceae bacterium]|nr:imidazoleglycerol-phosphate dehydratase HisB [Lachnospiraceae bacterium]
MRAAEVSRTTTETDIRLTLNLDGSGQSDIHTGVGFLDHMLTLFARHANFDLAVVCKGDTWVDDHHSVEDIGIALGAAIKEALGDKRGISRYASLALPMDEALVLVAVDISGRGGAYTDLPFPSEKIGTFDTELVREFFIALATNAGLTLHVRELAGENSHHIAEAAFKGLGHALRAAVNIDPAQADRIPSTKGLL